MLNKRIKRIVGYIKNNHVEAYAILFDDKETYIMLEEQDYNYHDCSKSARNIEVYKSKEAWKAYSLLKDAIELT